MDSKIAVLLEIKLVYPYAKSAGLLADMCNIWSCKIISLGTTRSIASVQMPWKQFKMIFGANQRIDDLKPPANTEHFIEEIEVLEIKKK